MTADRPVYKTPLGGAMVKAVVIQRDFYWSLTQVCCWSLIWPIQNDAKKWKMSETLTYGYSSESTQ